MADDRLTILRQLTNETLGALIAEIASDQIGMSPLFLQIGMSKEFRQTYPEELVDLCATVIKERIAVRCGPLDPAPTKSTLPPPTPPE